MVKSDIGRLWTGPCPPDFFAICEHNHHGEGQHRGGVATRGGLGLAHRATIVLDEDGRNYGALALGTVLVDVPAMRSLLPDDQADIASRQHHARRDPAHAPRAPIPAGLR